MTHPATRALEGETYLSLETFKKDGTGVKTPVWFAVLDGAVYVFTDGTSYKVKRVRNQGRGRIAACNVDGKKIRSPWFDAKAGIVDKGSAEEAKAYAALRKKYGLQMWLLDVGSKIGGRFGRRAMIRVDPT